MTDLPPEGITLEGHARFFGTEALLRLEVAADGRFFRAIDGPVPEILVFDGERVWHAEASGIAYEAEFAARDAALAHVALIAGLERSSTPLRLEAPALANLVRDDAGRARSWTSPGLVSDAGIDLSSWRERDGVAFPSRVDERLGSGVAHRFEFSSIRRGTSARFERPQHLARDFRFDPAAAPDVAIRRAESGHLFVRPRIDGADAGWFAFDTGAATTGISAAAADAASLDAFGESGIAGAGSGCTPTRLRRCRSFALGPLVIDGLVMTELPRVPMWGAAAPAAPDAASASDAPGAPDPMAVLSSLIGEPVHGIVGFDALMRGVAVLDPNRSRLALHDAERFALERGDWLPLRLHRRHPFVRARFEGDREGWFCIDSGAGALTVAFHSPTVERLALLDGRETQEAAAHGAGGEMSLRYGNLEWFELGGVRHSEPPALFATPGSGAFSDIHTEGTLGSAFLEPFELVLDYRGGRHALRRVAAASR